MTPAQLALMLQGEAALMSDKPKQEALPPMSDADDMVAFAARTGG